MAQEFKEVAFSNIDQKKFRKNYNKIFGEREKIDCAHCDLSSRQKKGEAFQCPHCKKKNYSERLNE